MTTIDPDSLLESYPSNCVCGHPFRARPSLAMQCGQNSGHGSCPACKQFLHLEIADCGTKINAERFEDYVTREKAQSCSDENPGEDHCPDCQRHNEDCACGRCPECGVPNDHPCVCPGHQDVPPC